MNKHRIQVTLMSLACIAISVGFVVWHHKPVPSAERSSTRTQVADGTTATIAAAAESPSYKIATEPLVPRVVQQLQARLRVLMDDPGSALSNRYSCRVVLRSAAEPRSRVVEAPDGEWEGALPVGEYSIIAISGEDSVPAIIGTPKISERQPEAIVHVLPVDHWTLSVLDSTDQHPLDNVSLYSIDGAVARSTAAVRIYTMNEHVIPPETESVVEGARSPLDVPERASRGFFWVQAPGYVPTAFRRNSYQHERVIQLSRSGSLAVETPDAFVDFVSTLLPQAQADRVVIDLTAQREGDASPVLKCSLFPAQRHILDGVACGSYVIRAEVLENGRPACTVFRRGVDVQPGTLTTVKLVPPEAACRPVYAPLDVTVILPQWSRGESESLRISRLTDAGIVPVVDRRLGDGAGTPGVPNRKRLRFSWLEVGTYRLQLVPLGEKMDIVLGADGAHVTFPCSPSSVVTVQIASHDGGRPERCTVWWAYAENGAMLRPGPAIAPGALSTEVLCSTRKIRLRLVGTATCSSIVECEPSVGTDNRVTLDLQQEQLAIVRMTLWSNGAHGDIDHRFWNALQFEADGGVGSLLGVQYGTLGTNAHYGPSIVEPDWAQAVFVLSSPGRYKVLIPGHEQQLVIEAPAGVSDQALGM